VRAPQHLALTVALHEFQAERFAFFGEAFKYLRISLVTPGYDLSEHLLQLLAMSVNKEAHDMEALLILVPAGQFYAGYGLEFFLFGSHFELWQAAGAVMVGQGKRFQADAFSHEYKLFGRATAVGSATVAM
jgi:hypothetical protein